MKRILVDNITDGMILEREVCGSGGNVLLSKGTHLSGALGKRLKNWGITFVYIQGEEDPALIESTQELSPEAIKAHLLKKFSNVINKPIMKQLFVNVYQFRTQKK